MCDSKLIPKIKDKSKSMRIFEFDNSNNTSSEKMSARYSNIS